MKEYYIYILIFFLYSFFGWIAEGIDSIIEDHKFINRGFLIGPIVPIYGVGGLLIMFLLNKYYSDPLALFFLSMILCTILEYTTSFLMEKIFKNRWWDYSDKRFNINGRVCLECSIPFGIGAIVVFYGINPYMFKLYDFLPNKLLIIISLVASAITLVDIILSFNIIIKLKNISNSIKCDSTEKITKKVRQILKSKTILYRRLLESFPDMKVFNKFSLKKLKKKWKRKKAKV